MQNHRKMAGIAKARCRLWNRM